MLHRYVWIYKKGDERKKRRMDGLTACSLVVWIVVRAIYIAVIHEAFLYELPFHLTHMAKITESHNRCHGPNNANPMPSGIWVSYVKK